MNITPTELEIKLVVPATKYNIDIAAEVFANHFKNAIQELQEKQILDNQVINNILYRTNKQIGGL